MDGFSLHYISPHCSFISSLILPVVVSMRMPLGVSLGVPLIVRLLLPFRMRLVVPLGLNPLIVFLIVRLLYASQSRSSIKEIHSKIYRFLKVFVMFFSSAFPPLGFVN